MGGFFNFERNWFAEGNWTAIAEMPPDIVHHIKNQPTEFVIFQIITGVASATCVCLAAIQVVNFRRVGHHVRVLRGSVFLPVRTELLLSMAIFPACICFCQLLGLVFIRQARLVLLLSDLYTSIVLSRFWSFIVGLHGGAEKVVCLAAAKRPYRIYAAMPLCFVGAMLPKRQFAAKCLRHSRRAVWQFTVVVPIASLVRAFNNGVVNIDQLLNYATALSMFVCMWGLHIVTKALSPQLKHILGIRVVVEVTVIGTRLVTVLVGVPGVVKGRNETYTASVMLMAITNFCIAVLAFGTAVVSFFVFSAHKLHKDEIQVLEMLKGSNACGSSLAGSSQLASSASSPLHTLLRLNQQTQRLKAQGEDKTQDPSKPSDASSGVLPLTAVPFHGFCSVCAHNSRGQQTRHLLSAIEMNVRNVSAPMTHDQLPPEGETAHCSQFANAVLPSSPAASDRFGDLTKIANLVTTPLASANRPWHAQSTGLCNLIDSSNAVSPTCRLACDVPPPNTSRTARAANWSSSTDDRKTDESATSPDKPPGIFRAIRRLWDKLVRKQAANSDGDACANSHSAVMAGDAEEGRGRGDSVVAVNRCGNHREFADRPEHWKVPGSINANIHRHSLEARQRNNREEPDDSKVPSAGVTTTSRNASSSKVYSLPSSANGLSMPHDCKLPTPPLWVSSPTSPWQGKTIARKQRKSACPTNLSHESRKRRPRSAPTTVAMHRTSTGLRGGNIIQHPRLTADRYGHDGRRVLLRPNNVNVCAERRLKEVRVKGSRVERGRGVTGDANRRRPAARAAPRCDMARLRRVSSPNDACHLTALEDDDSRFGRCASWRDSSSALNDDTGVMHQPRGRQPPREGSLPTTKSMKTFQLQQCQHPVVSCRQTASAPTAPLQLTAWHWPPTGRCSANERRSVRCWCCDEFPSHRRDERTPTVSSPSAAAPPHLCVPSSLRERIVPSPRPPKSFSCPTSPTAKRVCLMQRSPA